MTTAAADRLAAFRRHATLERVRTLTDLGMIRGLGQQVIDTWDAYFAANQLPVDEAVIRDAIEMAYAGCPWQP